MSIRPEKIHIYPLDSNGRTPHIIDSDFMCFCKPVSMQVCSEANQYFKCSPDCWRCGGQGVAQVYSPDDDVLIVHTHNGTPCLPTDKPIYFNQNYQSHQIPHHCPVCSGRGLVPFGFYDPAMQGAVDWTKPLQKCLTCDGQGIVWG